MELDTDARLQRRHVAPSAAAGCGSDKVSEPLFATRALLDRVHDVAEVEAARLLARWEVLEALEPFGDDRSGGRDHEQEADPHTAAAAAIQAFEDGYYYVFLDGEKQDELDREVYVGPDSRLTFVRLVPLIGG